MIYAHADARRVAIARIAILLVCWLDTALDPFPALAQLPRAWFSGHGPWALAPDALLAAIWNARGLWALKLATLGVLGLAIVGAPRARVWAGLSGALLTLTFSFVRGFGHADHSQLQLLLLALALPFLPAWDALALRRERVLRAPADFIAAFVALALVFGLPYFFTGVARLAQEGAAIFLGRSMQHFIARDTLSLDDFDSTLGLGLLGPGMRPLLNLGFFAVTLAELGSPWVYMRRGWAALWLLLIVPFHVLSPLLMHVLFIHNLALIAVLYMWPLSWAQTAREK